jgi:hypothetical protein
MEPLLGEDLALDRARSNLSLPILDPLDHRVVNKIKSILGKLPSREKLKAIALEMGWGPLSRNEKRVKEHLLARLENQAAAILPQLDTDVGRDRLLAAAARARSHGSTRADDDTIPDSNPALPASPLPLDATIKFYLNDHRNDVQRVNPM